MTQQTDLRHNDPTVATRTGSPFSIAAIVLGIVAVFLLPILLGPLAIVLGAVGMSRREPLGKIGLIVGIVGMVAGFALGAAYFASKD